MGRLSSVSFKVASIDGPPAGLHASGMLNPRPRPTFVKEWRKFRGLTQAQLGELAGMTAQNVHYIETGKSNYTQDNLESFARALGCTPVDLLVRQPEESEGLWNIWDKANPRQRRQILELSKTILNMPED